MNSVASLLADCLIHLACILRGNLATHSDPKWATYSGSNRATSTNSVEGLAESTTLIVKVFSGAMGDYPGAASLNSL